MDYDRETNDWTISLQILVFRTLVAGKMPVKLEVEVNYYAAQPDPFGPDWMLAINFGPVVPNIFDMWIKDRTSNN